MNTRRAMISLLRNQGRNLLRSFHTDKSLEHLNFSSVGNKVLKSSFMEQLINEAFPSMRPMLRKLPFLQLRSEVKDVVYLNWILDKDRVKHFVPDALKMNGYRLSSVPNHDHLTMFTILSYQHGHFGPRFLPPNARQLLGLPCPFQSNWRLYVTQDAEQQQTGDVYFMKSMINNYFHLFCARLLSDTLPAHLPDEMQHCYNSNSSIETRVKSDHGNSCPDLSTMVSIEREFDLPGVFGRAFESNVDKALDWIIHQNAAVCYTRANGIRRGLIDLQSTEPILPAKLTSLQSQWLDGAFSQTLHQTEPFCFVCPQIQFTVLNETD